MRIIAPLALPASSKEDLPMDREVFEETVLPVGTCIVVTAAIFLLSIVA